SKKLPKSPHLLLSLSLWQRRLAGGCLPAPSPPVSTSTRPPFLRRAAVRPGRTHQEGARARQEEEEGGQEDVLREQRRPAVVGPAREAVRPLPVLQDPAVEGGASGAQDPVQRLRRQVQVRQAAARVPARQQPHLRELLALQLPQEGHADAAGRRAAAVRPTSPGIYRWKRVRGSLRS
ncbi:GATA zinc finger family protein, partial [Zea mays]